MKTILILGGYGTFGGRLARLLADEPVTMFIAGRSLAKAAAFCARHTAQAHMVPLVFDRDDDVATRLREIKPDLVVDASGPFQAYGDDPYRLVKACLSLGIDYLDIADGTEFVRDIARFDDEARDGGIFVLSGASSLPVLTAAVVRRLAQGLTRVEAIRAGIAPSPFAGVGLNVIRAIAAYAGKPVALIRDGKPAIGYALADTLRCTIAPPGYTPLRNIRFALADVPDLQVLPAAWPDLKSIWVGVGPVPESLHRILNALARLVRWRLLPSLAPFARLFHKTINVLRWGEHRGGMFVRVGGRYAEDVPVERTWHMVAEGDDGPFIPSMTCAAIVKHVLAGKRPAAGARSAIAELELADYEAMFASRAIVTGVRETPSEIESAPLFQRILGTAWDAMPEPVRRMHELSSELYTEGVADVERGPGLLSRAVGALFRFPPADRFVRVAVAFTAEGGREVWRRNFAGRSFVSHLEAGRGRDERLLCERFGPLTFGLALVPREGRLHFIVRRWSLFGVPLPSAWAPFGTSYEFVTEDRFGFSVEIRHPLTGLIVRYRGWLAAREPARAPAAARNEQTMGEPDVKELSPLTVCYNGACPVCQAEIERYQEICARSAAGGATLPLGWQDINTAPEIFRRHNIDFDAAMRRLYAVDENGRLLRGIDVFVEVWRRIPSHRWLAAVVGFPPLRPAFWFIYEYLVSYHIYRRSRRMWRRRMARVSEVPSQVAR